MHTHLTTSSPSSTENMPSQSSHPTYAVMATAAVKNTKPFDKGASRPAIKTYIETTYNMTCAAPALRAALTKLATSGAVLKEGQRFKLSASARDVVNYPHSQFSPSLLSAPPGARAPPNPHPETPP